MTTDQLTLDLEPLTEPDYTPGLTLQQRFELWVEANPHAVTLALHLTREWLRAGHKRAAIDMIFNQMRWESGIRTADSSPWRLNNDYRSGLARLLMDRYPDLDGVFAIRRAPALDAA